MKQSRGHGKKRPKRRSGIKIIAAVVLLLCGIVTYNRINLEAEKQALEKRYEELQEQLTKAQERAAMLKERQIYMQTIPYIKERAREIGLVDPGDVIFRPNPEEQE